MISRNLVALMTTAVTAASVGAAMDIRDASAQVPVPQVEVPNVQVPPVPVAPPALPVTPPPVPTPPSLQPPSVQPPTVPEVPTPGAPSPPGGGGPAAAPPRDGDQGSSPAASGGSAPAGSDPSDDDSDGDRTGPSVQRTPASPAVSNPGEKGLRREVRRLSGCSGSLPRFERRVLDLRTGLGGAAPSPRREVAERLDVSLDRVRDAERKALVQLRLTNRANGCADGDSSRAIAWTTLMESVGVVRDLESMASLDEAATLASSGSPMKDTGGAVLGDNASSSAGAPQVDVSGDDSAAAAETAAAGVQDGPPIMLLLLAGLLLLGATAATPALLRRRRGTVLAGNLAPGDETLSTSFQGPPYIPARPPSAEVGPEPEQSAPPSEPRASEVLARAIRAAPPRAVPKSPAAVRAASPPRTRNKQALGVALSSVMSLAVGLAVRARRHRSGRGRSRR